MLTVGCKILAENITSLVFQSFYLLQNQGVMTPLPLPRDQPDSTRVEEKFLCGKVNEIFWFEYENIYYLFVNLRNGGRNFKDARVTPCFTRVAGCRIFQSFKPVKDLSWSVIEYWCIDTTIGSSGDVKLLQHLSWNWTKQQFFPNNFCTPKNSNIIYGLAEPVCHKLQSTWRLVTLSNQ